MTHPLRQPCRLCGAQQGRVFLRSAQATVWCLRCGTYQYNAPRSELPAERLPPPDPPDPPYRIASYPLPGLPVRR